jgi:hypothetical protein
MLTLLGFLSVLILNEHSSVAVTCSQSRRKSSYRNDVTNGDLTQTMNYANMQAAVREKPSSC